MKFKNITERILLYSSDDLQARIIHKMNTNGSWYVFYEFNVELYSGY